MKQERKQKTGKRRIEFRRDKEGNLYAVRDGKTVGMINSFGDRRS